MASGVIFGAVAVLAGALAGGGVALIVTHGKHPAPRMSQQSTPAIEMTYKQPESLTNQGNNRDSAAFKNLQGRLAALEQRGQRQPEDSTGNENPASVDAEEWKAHRERHHEELVQAHSRETRDSNWAPGAEAQLTTDFGATKSSDGFSVRGVDCRSKTCLVNLEWKNYGEAVAGWSSTVVRQYQLNCAREILLPEPSNPDVPYQASLVFSCDL
jgi:hypothetical protein